MNENGGMNPGAQGMPGGYTQPLNQGQMNQGMPGQAPQMNQGMPGQAPQMNQRMPGQAPQMNQGMPNRAPQAGQQGRRPNGKRMPKKNKYSWGPYVGILGVFAVMIADFFAKIGILIIAYILLVVINPGGVSGVTIDNQVLLMEKWGLRDSFYHTALKEKQVEASSVVKPEKAAYTVMVYMVGTNLESGSSCGTADIEEMINAELDDDVQVLIYAGGTTAWHNEVLSPAQHHICLVNNKGFAVLEDRDRVNMCDPEVLTDFIKMGVNDYPAEHYGLILWDHGNGPVVGYGYPEDVEDQDLSMNLAELDQAFENGLEGKKIDFIGFDACLMGSVETVQMVSAYTDCLICSPETTYGSGWYYTPFLTHLSKHKYDSVFTIADRVISSYNESIFGEEDGLDILNPTKDDEDESASEAESEEDKPLTYDEALENYQNVLSDIFGQKNDKVVMAVYDCRKIDDAIKALDKLTKRIREDYSEEEIARRAGVVKQYDSPDMIDAGMWALLYFPEYEEAEIYYDKVTDVVYDHSYSVDVGFCTGISQYLPTNENSFENYQQDYNDFIAYDWGSEEYRFMVSDIIDYFENPNGTSGPGFSELWSSMMDLFSASQNQQNETETETTGASN